jgi:hypothetical protein
MLEAIQGSVPVTRFHPRDAGPGLLIRLVLLHRRAYFRVLS